MLLLQSMKIIHNTAKGFTAAELLVRISTTGLATSTCMVQLDAELKIC